jgi:hypothetical protein
MVVHQDVRMNSDSKVVPGLAQQFQEVKVVGVIPEYLFAFVSSGSDMVASSSPLNAQRPCHSIMQA